MPETLKVRTLQRIDDPQHGGASIRANAVVNLPKQLAERLIAEGRAEKAKKNDR